MADVINWAVVEKRGGFARGEFVFGTRDPEYGVYALEHYVSELPQPGLEDYLLMGFDGHGIASQALHYYLVCGPLAVFIQRNYGKPITIPRSSPCSP